MKEEAAPVHSKTVEDMALYNQLGVPSTATFDEIKKAYRKKAIILHPDKNLNDPEAGAKFQALGEAYQILSNPQTRTAYDLKGKEAVNESGLFDSAQLYQIIFGSERFEGYVGELSLLSMKDAISGKTPEEMQNKMSTAEKTMKLRQKKREVSCAVKLAALLEQYVNDSSEEFISFKTTIYAEAKGSRNFNSRIK